MKRITVYADFDFLSAPQEIGTLGYEHVRGKDHFVFEYSRQWLKQHGGILLSGDLMNVLHCSILVVMIMYSALSRIPSPIAGDGCCLTAESD